MKKDYLPEDIQANSEEELLAEVKQAAKRDIGIERIQELKHAAETSVGLPIEWHVRNFVI